MSRYGERQRAKWARSGALRLGTWAPPFPPDWRGFAHVQTADKPATWWSWTPRGWIFMGEDEPIAFASDDGPFDPAGYIGIGGGPILLSVDPR